MKLGTYRLPGFHFDLKGLSGGSGGFPAFMRPEEPKGLKHTAPRERHLCLKQEVHNAWDPVSDPEVASKWKALAKRHNDNFNPSGVPFKSRRSHEPDDDTETQAEPLRPREGQYPDVAAIKARQHCHA